MSAIELDRIELRTVLRKLVETNEGVIKVIPQGGASAGKRWLQLAVSWCPVDSEDKTIKLRAWCSPSGLTKDKLTKLSDLGWNTNSTISQPNIFWEATATNFDFVSNSIWWSVETAFEVTPETRYRLEGNHHALEFAMKQSVSTGQTNHQPSAEIMDGKIPAEVDTNQVTGEADQPTDSDTAQPSQSIGKIESNGLDLGTKVSFIHRGSAIEGTIEELEDGFVMVRVVDSDVLPDNTYKMTSNKVQPL